MPTAAANGVELEYELFDGGPGSEPILLITGLGAQLVSWDDRFCEALVDEGFTVVRYDNRDGGLSSAMGELGTPDVLAIMLGNGQPPYTIADLADDADALLQALGLEAAHVVGASMGGMVALHLALRHPARVRSLAAIMASPGGNFQMPQSPEGLSALLGPIDQPNDAERVAAAVELRRFLSSTADFDEARARRRAHAHLSRGHNPAGTLRQLAAVLAAPDVSAELASLSLPCLVVHGDMDPLVPWSEGARIAAAIPGARLLTMPGAGHDVPERVGAAVVAALVENARRGRQTGRTG
ncbi:MAG TPA: alpha/beta hydrolase [Candidatus Dormibacteraeota bacterium]|jgi:pimeloyl-ACP methyl ester carboxylesterase|nr:alpha/beta hydrolase [Candidatus Dormibacteraeota bacterium]